MNRKQGFSFLALLVGILVAASLPLPAQQPKPTGLTGKVLDYEGNPMVGVTVEAKSDRGREVFQATTDENGQYLIEEMSGGSYTLRLVDEGQTLFQLRGVTVRSREVREVDVDLQAELERQKKSMSEEQLEQLEEAQAARKKQEGLETSFSQGLAYMKQEQYAEAITEFEAAAEIDPEQFAVFANLGRAYTSTNQPEKAVGAYQRAIELREGVEGSGPQLAPIYNNLGQLRLKSGDIEGAKQSFEKAAELNPDQAGAFYYNLGVTFYNANQLPAAVDPLRKATEIDPERADAYYLLAVCLLNTMESKMEGDQLKTILKPGTRESFEKYLALAPNGRFAEQSKQNLQVIDAMVSAEVSAKK